ncbi:MAG: nucleotidyltransferase domain-containing protein [Candidatus Brockarchaeota archaeon]|nr:nucleotidyltransferase domain-containing protein [Candidatus Brockarchaeota archaeon]
MLKRSSDSVRVFYPEIDRDSLILILKGEIEKLSERLRVRSVILFGSYATDRYTPASDIDLLVVIEDEDKEKAYSEIFKNLKISNLQLHLYTLKEYEKMKASGSLFIKEIEEKGIPIKINTREV